MSKQSVHTVCQGQIQAWQKKYIYIATYSDGEQRQSPFEIVRLYDTMVLRLMNSRQTIRSIRTRSLLSFRVSSLTMDVVTRPGAFGSVRNQRRMTSWRLGWAKATDLAWLLIAPCGPRPVHPISAVTSLTVPFRRR